MTSPGEMLPKSGGTKHVRVGNADMSLGDVPIDDSRPALEQELLEPFETAVRDLHLEVGESAATLRAAAVSAL